MKVPKLDDLVGGLGCPDWLRKEYEQLTNEEEERVQVDDGQYRAPAKIEVYDPNSN